MEHGDAENTKVGTYGYRDVNGIFRHVNYIADRYGFRVVVNTNEPGTAPMDAADAVFNAAPIKVLPVKAPKNLLAAENVWYRGLTKEYGGRYGFRTGGDTAAAVAAQEHHHHEDLRQSQDDHLSEYDYYEE
ncbi:hypothetical protein V5799_016871 [Amblyomma americanum]|uniref:Cuticle protein n=1 Tax=Amblyomma americanum TaxID=6943 RepID=A0AAQ4F526_AMBAM